MYGDQTDFFLQFFLFRRDISMESPLSWIQNLDSPSKKERKEKRAGRPTPLALACISQILFL